MLRVSRRTLAIRTLATVIVIAAVAQVGPAAGQEQVTFVQNGDAKLRVFMEGNGPGIVLLPGQGRGPRDFDDVAKHFVAAGYRVIRPEPRGFGESVGPVENVTLRDNAADVAAAIEKASVAPAIVAGWAYGNRVARMLATERPDLVRGVVLIAAGGKYPPKPEVMTNVRRFQDKSLPLETRAEAARAALYGPKSTISATAMRLDEVSEATVKAQSLAPTPSIPLESWWNGGKAPMLVLQGLQDAVAPPENGRSLRQDHPDRVTLVEFEDLGHAMVRERPDLIADAMVTWARELR
jgi:pimeloyl-ACP methyl ester carboxylesterase